MISCIQEVVVASHYGVKFTDMLSRESDEGLTLPSRVSLYLTVRLTHHSLAEIGRHFGGRHHTSVCFAARKTELLAEEDPALAKDLKSLKIALRMPEDL